MRPIEATSEKRMAGAEQRTASFGFYNYWCHGEALFLPLQTPEFFLVTYTNILLFNVYLLLLATLVIGILGRYKYFKNQKAPGQYIYLLARFI